jgi:hypothetical protein|tara:strand:+ start:1171 stop:1845 length:675 start_codon:yes stop_codon:yes gene_type:complete
MKNSKVVIGLSIGVLLSTGLLILLKRMRLSGFKKNLISNTNKEWKLWGKPLISQGKLQESGEFECSDIYRERVGEYWRKGVNSSNDGCSNVPWSSAFISFIMRKSGAGNDFPYSSAHNNYIRPFIQNRKKNLNSDFKAYKVNEEKPKLGDLVCYSRESGVDYDTTSSYKGHCDIVVDINRTQRTIEVIGGNVNDGVTKRVLNIDKNGYLNDTSNDWFTIIKNNK